MASPSKTTRPSISERLQYGGQGVGAYLAPPTPEPTWTGTHHKHTLYYSDEVWAALAERADGSEGLSKSAHAEAALRAYLGLD